MRGYWVAVIGIVLIFVSACTMPQAPPAPTPATPSVPPPGALFPVITEFVPSRIRVPVEYDIEPVYSAPLPSPNDIVSSADGSFLVALGDIPVIKKVTRDGHVSDFISLPRPVQCLAYNSLGELYAGSGSEIWKISSEGKVTVFAHLAQGEVVTNMAFGSDNHLYTVQWGSFSPDIKKISPGDEVTSFAGGLVRAFDIQFSPSGGLFVSDPGAGKLYRVTKDRELSVVVSGLWTDPSPIAFDREGNLFLRTGWRGKTENGLYKVSLQDGSVTPIILMPLLLSGSDSMVVDDFGNIFLPACTYGTVQKVTPKGDYSVLVEFWHNPEGLIVGQSGNLFLADHSRAPLAPGRIIRLDMKGNVSTFLEDEELQWPMDLAFDNSGNLLVADLWAGQVSRITVSGEKQVLADNLRGPESIAFDPSSGDLFVYSNANDEILRISEQGQVSTLPVRFEKDVRTARLVIDQQGNLLACVVYMDNIGIGPTVANLFKISPDGGKKLLAEFSDPVPAMEVDLAVNSSGNAFLLTRPEGGFGISKVTPQGEGSVFANGLPTDPFGIVVAPNDDIFFTSATGIYRIFPVEKRVVDGKSSDWQDLAPLAADPKGDSKDKLDIKALYGFTDDKFVYLMAEFYEFADFWDMIVSLDFNGDKQPEYRCAFSRDRTFDAVSLWDLRIEQEIPYQRRGLCQIGEVAEVRIPLAYIENRAEFGVHIAFNGKTDSQFYTIDFTDWVYLPKR